MTEFTAFVLLIRPEVPVSSLPCCFHFHRLVAGKAFGISNPGLNSLCIVYLVWASVVRVDLAYGKQTKKFVL